MNKILISLFGLIILTSTIGLSYAEDAPILQTDDQFTSLLRLSSEFDLSAHSDALYAYQDTSDGLEILKFIPDVNGNYVADLNASIILAGIGNVDSIASSATHNYVIADQSTIHRSDGFSWFADVRVPDIAVRTVDASDYIYAVDFGESGELKKFIITSDNVASVQAKLFVFKNTAPRSITTSDSGFIYISHSDDTIDVYEDLGTSFGFIETISFDHALVDIEENNGSLFIADDQAKFYKYSNNGTNWNEVWNISLPVQIGIDIHSITAFDDNVFIINEIDGISRYLSIVEIPDNPFTLSVLPPLTADTLNVVNHKRTIPIQFELIDEADNIVLDQTATLTTTELQCESTSGSEVSSTTQDSDDDTTFRITDNKYILNYSTKSLLPDTCYQLSAEINGILEPIVTIRVR